VGHIIHVDNSGFFRKLMQAFLADMGQESESYARGEDALDAVETGNVSCVITGLELVDMSGEEFIKQLFFAPQPVSIIAVTGSSDEDRNRRLEALGVMAIVQKSGTWKEELRKILT
jgi:CheY-like chemotaxis protein